MKEAENQNNPKIGFRYIVAAILLIGCISMIVSYFAVKVLVPPTSAPTPTLYVLPSTTPSSRQTQSSEFEEPLRENQGFEIETNLLQNSGFENGLAGWNYTDDSEGITPFEIEGVNGKASCSRRPIRPLLPDLLDKSWVGFAQEIPLDPTQSYFFSAWIKLNEARNIDVHMKFYSGATEAAIGYLAAFGYSLPETSNGWFFIHNVVNPSGISRTPNRMVIEIIHDKLDINRDTQPTFSTICIDDVFFGRIVK